MNVKVKGSSTLVTALLAVTVMAGGGAMLAYAAPADAAANEAESSPGILVTIADIVKWKYQEAVAEAAEDAAEAQRAVELGAPDAAEETAEAERSAREAQIARALAEEHADNKAPVTLPGDGRDIDFDDVIVSADGTIVQWDDDRDESHDADGRENDRDDDWDDRDDAAYDDADDDAYDDDDADDADDATLRRPRSCAARRNRAHRAALLTRGQVVCHVFGTMGRVPRVMSR